MKLDSDNPPRCGPNGVDSVEVASTSIRAIVRVFVNLFGKLILAGVLAAALILIFGMLTFNMPPFKLKKLDQLKPGMSKEEVKRVLGNPSSGDEKARFHWVYAGWGWPMVHVYFDLDQRYESSEYDY